MTSDTRGTVPAIRLKRGLMKKGFKMLFGQNLYPYHLQLKMEKAKESLQAKRERLDYIVYTLGYSQASSFGHEFKKVLGQRPGSIGGTVGEPVPMIKLAGLGTTFKLGRCTLAYV